MRISGEFTAPFAGLDDPVACLLHLFGGVCLALQAGRLVQRAGTARRRAWALTLFAAAGVMVLGASATYHAVALDNAWKTTLQRIDHAAIFLLIAATLTAFLSIGFHGRGRIWLVGLVWAIALSALVGKTLYWATLGDGVGLALYIGLSAVGLSALLFLQRRLPWVALTGMLGGAILYCAGAVADHIELAWLIPGVFGPHEIFHVAVLGALVCHWHFFATWSAPGAVPLAQRRDPISLARPMEAA